VEEQDVLRAELALNKRKLEETVREVDTHKRKVTLSKADGKAEAQMEVTFFCSFLFYSSALLTYYRYSLFMCP